MSLTAILTVLLAASASAQYLAIIPAEGNLSPGPFGTLAGELAAKAAGRHPNVTSAVTFDGPTVNGTQQTWTWRLNITDFAIPNNITEYGMPSADYSDGYHVVNTQWQLEWPQGKDNSNQSLQSLLSDNGESLFYVQTFTMMAPSNITNGWTSPSDGSCNSVFGDACTTALIEQASSGAQADYYYVPTCDSTFGIALTTPGSTGTGFGKSRIIDCRYVIPQYS